MKITGIGVAVILSALLGACGSDNDNDNQTQDQAPQGVISSQQREALEAASSVEQILQDSAEERKKALEAQLQRQ